jgi:hypothetical protein
MNFSNNARMFFLVAMAVCGVNTAVSSLFHIPSVSLKKIKVVSSNDPNKSSVSLVHIVFPKTAALCDSLKKMSSADYFSQADELKSTNANDIEVVVIESVPGQMLDRKIKLQDFKSVAAIVFVRYDEKIQGPHRAEIAAGQTCSTISIGPTTFSVS